MMGLVTLPLNSLTVAYTSIPLQLVFLPIYLTWFHGNSPLIYTLEQCYRWRKAKNPPSFTIWPWRLSKNPPR